MEVKMCTVIFAYKAHPEFDWILVGNRDEFHHRPSASAHFWEEHPELLAGKDLEKGGTWTGITKTGRFALLTNHRNPLLKVDTPLSRGFLTLDFLTHPSAQLTAQEYATHLCKSKKAYEPYNLIVGDVQGLYYVNNITDTPMPIEPGVHGLSNALLNTPWPKVEKAKAKMNHLIEHFFTVSDLFEILDDHAPPEDDELPSTGVSLETERLLSTIHIESDHYGTQYKTVMLIDKNRLVRFYERHKTKNGIWKTHDFSFYVK